jgi:hypothetical protein
VTLGITIAYLSLPRHTFDQKELREVTRDDNEAVIGGYHSVICDALTGKVYAVTDRKFNFKATEHVARAEPEPSKAIYFEYCGRKAPYSHIVCQMEDQDLSPQERQRVTDAYRHLPRFAHGEPLSQDLASTCVARRRDHTTCHLMAKSKPEIVGSAETGKLVPEGARLDERL